MEKALIEERERKLITAIREFREAGEEFAELNKQECHIRNEQNRLQARRRQLDKDIVELGGLLRG